MVENPIQLPGPLFTSDNNPISPWISSQPLECEVSIGFEQAVVPEEGTMMLWNLFNSTDSHLYDIVKVTKRIELNLNRI